MSETTEIIYLIENAGQGSPLEQIESGKAARVELNALTSRIAALEAQLEEAEKVISPFAENYKAFLKTNDASNIRKGWFAELQQAYEYMNKVTQ